MTARRWYVSALLPLIATFVFSRPASAQTDEDHFQTLPFNFSNPGARPTAMGGAFIGLADDASAAVANPAGLTSLVRRQQLYFEYKHQQAPVAVLNRSDSLLTGFGELSSPVAAEMPAFFNFATRLTKDGSKHAITAAVSAHEFLNYENNFNPALPDRRTATISSNVFPGVTTTADLKGFSYSGAFGIVLNPKLRGDVPMLRAGLNFSINRLSADVNSQRHTRADCPTCAAIPSTAIHGSAYAPGFTAGLLFQAAPQLSVGLLYAYEPSFKLQERATGGSFCAVPASCSSAAASDTSWDVPFNLPSRAGVGLGYSAGRVRAVFDAVHVDYSRLVEDQTLVLFRHITDSFAGVGGLTSSTLQAEAAKVTNSSGFNIPNSTELRGGVEINVHRKPGIYVRYGAFYRPSHSVTFSDAGCDVSKLHQASFACPLIASYYIVQATTPLVNPELPLPIDPATGSVDLSKAKFTTAVPLLFAEKGVSFGMGFNIGRSLQFDGAYSQSTYAHKEFVLSSTIRFELHPSK